METMMEFIEIMIDYISAIVDFVISCVTSFSAMILSQPLLLMLVVAVPLCGIGVGMLRRLINTN